MHRYEKAEALLCMSCHLALDGHFLSVPDPIPDRLNNSYLILDAIADIVNSMYTVFFRIDVILEF